MLLNIATSLILEMNDLPFDKARVLAEIALNTVESEGMLPPKKNSYELDEFIGNMWEKE